MGPVETKRIHERLVEWTGCELPVDEVARRLYGLVADIAAPVVGAMHVTCADESERECIDALQSNFCEHLLPRLKFGERAPFRLANLGGRYEEASIHIADDHFSIPEARKSWKLLLLKINSHVSIDRRKGQLIFGRMPRYHVESIYCGALHALMAGAQHPFCDDLRRGLGIGGMDRLALLLDDATVKPEIRSLIAAVTGAGVQARRALEDIRSKAPECPTLFLVLPCVTLNRMLKDAEIVCGAWIVDWRGNEPEVTYEGLGDDPSRMRLGGGTGGVKLTVEDQVTDRRAD